MYVHVTYSNDASLRLAKSGKLGNYNLLDRIRDHNYLIDSERIQQRKDEIKVNNFEKSQSGAKKRSNSKTKKKTRTSKYKSRGKKKNKNKKTRDND